MNQLIECVPNFSEGNNKAIIHQIAHEIEKINGVKLLHIDIGKDTNRTVMTFVGTPDAVIEAAYQAIKKASELIDMSVHKGKHPRMGATDVCPLIPIKGITTDELVSYSLKLAQRVGEELQIPVYLYEHSQKNADRKNLAIIRKGEYEGFFQKIKLPEWLPDFGPQELHIKSGATVIGVRDFLIAYNVNLNTTSVELATNIAVAVRESGCLEKTESTTSRKRIPGSLKHVKAIGWYIKEYGITQVSTNLVDIVSTPIHTVFDEVCKKASEKGIRVTGSELVGMIPLEAMLDAGRYFLKKQNQSSDVSEDELIHIAVKSMGLDDLKPFNSNERIIEYALNSKQNALRLVDKTVTEFSNDVAGIQPTPGGGSVAAYVGNLALALTEKVGRLSVNKLKEDSEKEVLFILISKVQQLKEQLLQLVDEDAKAFNEVMLAYKLPKSSDVEIEERAKCIQKAIKQAIDIPFETLNLLYGSLSIVKQLTEKSIVNCISDIGVGVVCLRSVALGAFMNIKINAKSYHDKIYVQSILTQSEKIVGKTIAIEKEILDIVNDKLSH